MASVVSAHPDAEGVGSWTPCEADVDFWAFWNERLLKGQGPHPKFRDELMHAAKKLEYL